MIELVEVRTNDAHPVDSPHRISAQPGKNTALVTIVIASTGPIRAWRLVHASEPRSAEPLLAGGAVTGLDRAGIRRPLNTPSPFELRFAIAQPQLGGEGDYPLDVHAASREEGWL